ncbi:MAG TPA: Na/Pi cotransporter family protein [Candidatus Borkfalkia faecipullorum]|uniref:Na/Pi cotransporter family protein n=1 Tax=Candidatus Borkfalkia faecipullorum TaxID=2838510 RepID=A0A9D2AEH6_9FIRM|nr:Na/Pi cotransporter family protein [Candidatus Borkfalkia faecipullorum]
MSILPCYGILAAVLGAMDYTLSVVSLLAGLGAFLFGFKVLSDNIEKLATNRLRSWFDKTGKSRLAGVGIGTAVTAIIQSSSATTVMVVGFVNAGLMSLFQATTVIMGANIGTTITAYIASMAEIPLIEFVTAFTCVGVFMNMLCKSDKVKTIGLMLAGLGLVFLGLEYMSNAMSIYKDSPEFRNFLTTVSNPFLLLIIGLIFTAIVQSSSAVTSLVIVMVGQGLVIGDGGNDVLFLVLGSNIGTCITAILSSIGANTNAKRASLIHLMFNVFGSVIFTVFLLCWPTFMQDTLATWFPNAAGLQIALFHTFFNVVCTCMFLPMANIFVKIATCIIPGKKGAGETAGDSVLLDERFITTPSVAVSQANKAASRMAELAMQSMTIALDGFLAGDESRKAQVDELNARVADMEKRIVAYLIKISASDLSLTDERLVSSIHHATSDIIRISELADNVTKYTRNCKRDNIEFSAGVLKSLQEMYAKIQLLYKKTLEVFDKKDITAIKAVDEVEDSVDASRKEMVKDHIRRLNEGKCKPESSGVFINLVGNLERAADHLTYVAHAFD